MSNEKPNVKPDASKMAAPRAPDAAVADKDKAAKMTTEANAKPVEANPAKK